MKISCEYWEIFKSVYFGEHLGTDAFLCFPVSYRNFICYFRKDFNFSMLTLKRREGERERSIWPPPPFCGFSKNIFSKERVKSWFFVTFNIILRHIFPKNFIEFTQVVQKVWRNFLSISANFHQFSSIF